LSQVRLAALGAVSHGPGSLTPLLLGQTPSLHPLRSRWRTTGLVRRLHRYYGPVRLPGFVHRRRALLGSRRGLGQNQAEPGISRLPNGGLSPPCEVLACVHGVSDHAESGRISRWRSARCCLPKVGSCRHSGCKRFRGSIPSPHVPLSTLREHPRECSRMTRSRCGSLDLHRMKLSFTTPHRLLPAHPTPFHSPVAPPTFPSSSPSVLSVQSVV